MAAWLVHLSLDQVVRVKALAGDIVFCSWARRSTLFLCASIAHGKAPETFSSAPYIADDHWSILA